MLEEVKRAALLLEQVEGSVHFQWTDSVVQSAREGFQLLQQLPTNVPLSELSFEFAEVLQRNFMDEGSAEISTIWGLFTIVLGYQPRAVDSQEKFRSELLRWLQSICLPRENLKCIELMNEERPLKEIEWAEYFATSFCRVLIGEFSGGVEMLQAAVQFLRTVEGASFTPDEETCISNIFSLYYDRVFPDRDFHLRWSEFARENVNEARYVLVPNSPDREPVAQLKGMLLDLLLIAAGDRELLHSRLEQMGLSTMAELACSIAVLDPCILPGDIVDIFVPLASQDSSWYIPVFMELFAALQEDTNSHLEAALKNISNLHPLGDANASFCARFMTTHCALMLHGAITQSEVASFVWSYVDSFSKCPLLWSIALRYLFMEQCPQDLNAVAAVCEDVIPLIFEEGHTRFEEVLFWFRKLKQQKEAQLSESLKIIGREEKRDWDSSDKKIYEAYVERAQEIFDTIWRAYIRHCVHKGQFSTAISLCLERDESPEFLEFARVSLSNWIDSHACEKDAAVQIGEAVHHSNISFGVGDSEGNEAMEHYGKIRAAVALDVVDLLHCCGYLYEFHRARSVPNPSVREFEQVFTAAYEATALPFMRRHPRLVAFLAHFAAQAAAALRMQGVRYIGSPPQGLRKKLVHFLQCTTIIEEPLVEMGGLTLRIDILNSSFTIEIVQAAF